MRERLVVLVAVLGLFAAQAAAAPARPAARGVICGQIKNGPHAAFWSNVTNLKLKGRTWTVIATGMPCSYAIHVTPGLLTQWAKARIGAPLRLHGGRCIKMTDRAYSGAGLSSGGFVCRRGVGPLTIFASNTFAARMTDGWTTAQIKAYLGLG
jgi:hypothetical protein